MALIATESVSIALLWLYCHRKSVSIDTAMNIRITKLIGGGVNWKIRPQACYFNGDPFPCLSALVDTDVIHIAIGIHSAIFELLN